MAASGVCGVQGVWCRLPPLSLAVGGGAALQGLSWTRSNRSWHVVKKRGKQGIAGSSNGRLFTKSRFAVSAAVTAGAEPWPPGTKMWAGFPRFHLPGQVFL